MKWQESPQDLIAVLAGEMPGESQAVRNETQESALPERAGPVKCAGTHPSWQG